MQMATAWSAFKSFLARNTIVWKNALGCALAWKIGELTGSTHPYLAPVAVILCLQVTIDKTIRHAWQRVLGTIVGVVVVAIAASFLGIHAWSIGVVIFVGTALAKLMKLGQQVIHQVALSVVLVLVFENKTPHYGFDRIVESAIGAMVAILLNMLLFPPNFTQEALQSIDQLIQLLETFFAKMTYWVEQGCSTKLSKQLHQDSTQLLQKLHQAEKDFSQAENSLKYNPLTQENKKQNAQSSQQLLQLQKSYAHFSGMLRTFTDWARSGLMTREDQIEWAARLQSLTQDFKAWGDAVRASGKTDAKVPQHQEHQQETKTVPFDSVEEKEKYSFALQNDAMQMMKDLQIERSQN